MNSFKNNGYESLKIRTKKVSEIEFCVLFFIEGFIDQQNISDFQEEIDKALASGYINFIFDFEELTYIASATLGVFSDLQESIGRYGGALVFYGLQGKPLDVFTVLGFYDYYPITDDIDQAIEYLLFRDEEEDEEEEKVKVFPKTVECPICSARLRATKPGIFTCASCKIVLNINNSGNVTLG
ncbi:MAG: STAS domain-containing protein [Spirochaetales bacterium]|nr:STAS domain-containing protein [Spirochaetales bacterium]